MTGIFLPSVFGLPALYGLFFPTFLKQDRWPVWIVNWCQCHGPMACVDRQLVPVSRTHGLCGPSTGASVTDPWPVWNVNWC